MLWNRFDQDRKKLDLYANPHFEPESGISDRDEIMEGVERMLYDMEGQPHTLIKARCFEYVLDHAAIEVNPVDWFGINFAGWYTQGKAQL